jgi:hypothetical protein
LNSDFLRREWGAVSFLIVTALGILVVPIGLNLNHRNFSPPPESIAASPSPSASPAVSPSASVSPVVSPSPAVSPEASPAPSPSEVPSPSPS